MMPIPVPRCDKIFDVDCKGDRAIPFTRSLFVNGSTPRAPLSDITAWIDASMIYGSSELQAKKLRSFSEG